MRSAGLIGLLLTASSAHAQLTMAEASEVASARNLELQQRAADVDVAKARVGGASMLLTTNPTVTLSLGPRFGTAGRSLDYGGQLMQQLELAGQRGARVDAAEAGVAAATAQLQAAQARLKADVRSRFGRALAAGLRVALAQEAQTLAQQSFTAADERFRAGSTALIEVNTARVELGRVTRARADTERARSIAHGELRLTLGLDAAEALAPQGDLAAEVQAALPAEEPLIDRALGSRFELAQARKNVEAAQSQARLASREWLPSPRLGVSVSHEQESQATIVQGVLAFDLPVFNRNQGPRAVSVAQVRQAQLALTAVERAVAHEVRGALARATAARAAAEGYRADVVKAMQENMDLVNDSYRAGRIDFLQLVVIRRQALEARREFIDVLEELNSARAELELAIGGDF